MNFTDLFPTPDSPHLRPKYTHSGAWGTHTHTHTDRPTNRPERDRRNYDWVCVVVVVVAVVIIIYTNTENQSIKPIGKGFSFLHSNDSSRIYYYCFSVSFSYHLSFLTPGRPDIFPSSFSAASSDGERKHFTLFPRTLEFLDNFLASYDTKGKFTKVFQSSCTEGKRKKTNKIKSTTE